jgi:hypothetical protein
MPVIRGTSIISSCNKSGNTLGPSPLRTYDHADCVSSSRSAEGFGALLLAIVIGIAVIFGFALFIVSMRP